MVGDSLESGSLRRREISTVMVKSLIPSRSTDDLRSKRCTVCFCMAFGFVDHQISTKPG